MAMPFIIHHDENIYSLDAKQSAKLKKPPRYSSKYRSKITNEFEQSKSVHKTMGYAEVPLDPPDKFLKRGGGIKAKRPVKDHVCFHKNLPALPKQGGNKEKNAAGDDGNAVAEQGLVDDGGDGCGGGGADGGAAGSATGRQKPLRTIRIRPRYVDSNRGDTHDLKRSGLMPTYVYQADFGKLPKYLIKRIRDAALQEEMFRDAQVRKQPLCRYVTQEERAELLGVSHWSRLIKAIGIAYIYEQKPFFYISCMQGLKHNWEELQKVYQGLPVLTDTIPKMIRKTKLENDLKQLEKDILLVENLPYIYVYNSNETGK